MPDDLTLTALALAFIVVVAAITKIFLKILDNRCKHTWEIIEEIPVYNSATPDINREIPTHHRLIMRCSKCGECKSKNMR